MDSVLPHNLLAPDDVNPLHRGTPGGVADEGVSMGRFARCARCSAVAAAFFGACSKPPVAASYTAESAGVQVVTSRRGLWDSNSAWYVAPSPSVRIGVVLGNDEYQLFNVVDAVQLRDGTIAIADRGTHSVKIYDSLGRFVARAGRRGDGPGEFRSLSSVLPLEPDSIVAVDWWGGAGRLDIFTTNGVFVRSVELRLDAFGLEPLHVFDDGTYAAQKPGRDSSQGYGVSRANWIQLLRFGSNGDYLDTLSARYPSFEAFSLPPRVDGQGLATFRAFGHQAVFAFGTDHLFIGSGDRYEIDVYGLSGSLERAIRRAVDLRQVRSADRAAYMDFELREKLDEGRGWRRRMRAVFTHMSFPKVMPAYSAMVVDAAGDLWVEYYRPEWETSSVWTVFDTAGRMLGDVRLPLPVEIYTIGQGKILAKYRNQEDVEFVYVYKLRRPHAPS